MEKLLNVAIEAALKAGVLIMDVYENQEFKVSIKDDNTPVTIADKKANDVIVHYLASTEIPVISEESEQLDYNIRKNWNLCWVVDPLDGTKEFIKKNGEFTVNIALVKDGKPLLGVIYVPVQKKLYYADVTTKKSYRMVLDDTSSTISEIKQNAIAIHPVKEEKIIKIATSRSHKNQAIKDLYTSLKNQGEQVTLLPVGSSLKFCMLAEGTANYYPRFAPTMEWDTAAGHAICNAVGIQIIEYEKNTELIYNKKSLKNPWFSARVTQ